MCRSPIDLESFYKLDVTHQVLEYEPKPVDIAYAHAGLHRRYIPDVLVHYKDGRKLLLEIKSIHDAYTPENVAEFRAALEFAATHGLEFRLWVYDGLSRTIWTKWRIIELLKDQASVEEV